MAVKFIGLKDLKNELAKIERSVKQVNNTPIKELLPSNFLKQYTIFFSRRNVCIGKTAKSRY